METLLFAIAMINAGLALMAGFTSLVVGKRRGGFELLFSIQAFLLFFYLVLPPSGFILRDKPPYPWILDLKRLFIWAYYGIFPFFLEGYSGYRNRLLKWTIVGTLIIGYMIYLATGNGGGLPVWRVFVLIPLGLGGVYGILASRYQLREKSSKEGRWLFTASLIYILLFAVSAGYVSGGTLLEQRLGFYPFVLFHFNPLAFIFIMSIRLKKDVWNQFKLEKLLREKDSRWEKLLDNIPLLALELDTDGRVLYCNPCAVTTLGARSPEEVVGQNWFKTFIKPESESQLLTIFRQALRGDLEIKDLQTVILGKDGKEHRITWTGVKLTDEAGRAVSMMGLGTDTTRLDQAFRDLEELKNELTKENVRVYDNDDAAGSFTEIVGNSDAIIYTIQKAKQVAQTHATVLLEGETGVGKELFANLIHKLSDRRNRPMVKVNCAALPHELIESELFGHEKGAFTGALQARKGRFELADKGTIFLDEISEMPLSLQPKLLRVLQTGEFERIGGQQTIKVDVRVISATNRNLMDEVRGEKFRKDLYYRLHVYPITIPSLRNRRSDILLLVNHYVKRFAIEMGKDIQNISRADIMRLEEYDWPGNIRELVNLVERSVISSPGETLKIAWENEQSTDHERDKAIASIHDLEREHILKVLKETNWKINGSGGASEKLGLNPNTLRSRMKKMNIQRGEHP